MEIDKSKLKLGIWYEDENGNLIKPEDDLACQSCYERTWTFSENYRKFH